ncbi:hypothetical protein RHMOL_Rhmol12G0202500 [Rhododendron molle]|uniref:Uncharacterized protein n=1 Tax=Rhododendron molle TaxID=49168 RepID=A0ACC0LKG9_RHOML|nr:hypothetical protein RHMOL_Rhmol12G0202500 [Rhododendron molle]
MASSTVIFPSTTPSSSTSHSKNYYSACILKRHVRTLSFPSARTFTNRASRTTMPGSKSYRSGFTKCFSASSSPPPPSLSLPSALLFDCDGVLVDTEKDGHRISFNDTFAEKELGVTWDVDLYGELLKIGGGKERMTAYFNKTGWPEKAPKGEEERKQFIASLHKRKTELFMALIEKKLLPLRPGVAKLIDQALAKGVKVAVCSTSNEKAVCIIRFYVSAIVSCLLGPDRAEKITIFAGDVVPRKKPDPAIYVLAATTLGVQPSRYTAEEDFVNADAVFDCIGDPPEERFDLAFCGSLLEKQYVS